MHLPATLPATRRAPDPLAGVTAGLLAGAVYLVAQVVLVSLQQGGLSLEPVERMSAILLGGDVAPPGRDLPGPLLGIGLLIHLALAIVFGRFVDFAVRDAPLLLAAVLGAAVGFGLYAIDFVLIAPLAFPWFGDSPRLVTILDHLLFGAVAGMAVYVLRRRPVRRVG